MKTDGRRPVSSDSESSTPQGFALTQRRVRAKDEPNTLGALVELYLPVQLHAQLRLEQTEAADRIRAEAALAASRQPEACTPPVPLPLATKAEADETPLRELDRWQDHATQAATADRRARHPVFDTAQAIDLYKRSRLQQDTEDRERLQRLYEQLSAKGSLRNIARPQVAALKHLAATQPHMACVVDFVLDQIALGRRAREAQRLTPILLVGEPGIGKTHFAQGLAQALGAPLSIQRLDSDLTGSLWLGSDKKWSNSQHGLLFELLALGEAANPVIVLDEIDKINRRSERVQSSLYSILEPVSATRLRDISLEFELDAHLVTWIATANDASRLDQPLRSRFREFHIQLPDAAQCLVLAAEVMRATIRAAGLRRFEQHTGRLERHLAHLPAREIQQATREALARALKAGRKHLERRDLPEHVLDGEAPADGQRQNYLH
jgi:ATP-dependent Lon protease